MGWISKAGCGLILPGDILSSVAGLATSFFADALEGGEARKRWNWVRNLDLMFIYESYDL